MVVVGMSSQVDKKKKQTKGGTSQVREPGENKFSHVSESEIVFFLIWAMQTCFANVLHFFSRKIQLEIRINFIQ